MTSNGGRILPFLAASVAVHVAAIGALGTNPLEVSLSDRGASQVISIRLEAAAPAPSASDTREAARAATPPSTSAPTRPPEPERSRSGQRSPRTVTTASDNTRPAPEQPAPAEPRPADSAGADDANPTDVAQESREAATTADAQARPAERVAQVDEAATASARTTSRASTSEARKALVAELAKYFHYPRLARRRGWEGTVVLSVRILPSGRLANVRIVRSSGRAVLDRSAVGSLGHVQRLPRFANRVGSDGIALEIPVTYRLESA